MNDNSDLARSDKKEGVKKHQASVYIHRVSCILWYFAYEIRKYKTCFVGSIAEIRKARYLFLCNKSQNVHGPSSVAFCLLDVQESKVPEAIREMCVNPIDMEVKYWYQILVSGNSQWLSFWFEITQHMQYST